MSDRTMRLLEARRSIEKHIKNAYLKRVQAPVGIKPVLSVGWNLIERGGSWLIVIESGSRKSIPFLH